MNKLTILLTLLTACASCSGDNTGDVTYGEEVLDFAEAHCTILQDTCGFDFEANGFTHAQCVEVTKDSVCDNVNPVACQMTLQPHNLVEFARCKSDLAWYAENHRCDDLWRTSLPNSCVHVINLREYL